MLKITFLKIYFTYTTQQDPYINNMTEFDILGRHLVWCFLKTFVNKFQTTKHSCEVLTCMVKIQICYSLFTKFNQTS